MIKFFLSLIAASFIYHAELFASDKTPVISSPISKESKEYGGYVHKENKYDPVKVHLKPCISLGKSCISQIGDIIEKSDEFVVAFMYRFDSPQLIHVLSEKYIQSKVDKTPVPVMIFLDYHQASTISATSHLMQSIPTTFVKLGSYSFHQKVIICKKKGQKAFVIIGSANATADSDSSHSEDSIIIQSNTIAEIFLLQFKDLLIKTEKKEQKNVYHVHRLQDKTSNTKKLEEFIAKINSNLHGDKDDNDFLQSSYEGTLVSLGISSPLTPQGQKSCLKALLEKLDDINTSELVLFENFLTLDFHSKIVEVKEKSLRKKKSEMNLESEDSLEFFSKKLWNTIEADSTSKLIVLDDDKAEEFRDKNTNFATVKEINGKHNITALLARPFTDGKLHHKLLIQYFNSPKLVPIVYTGSFNLSNAAITGNSETIIGIECRGLAEDYLSSIIWQTGLWRELSVWEFLSTAKPQNFMFEKLKNVAHKAVEVTNMNMQQYSYRIEKILSTLPLQEKDEIQCEEFLSEFADAEPSKKLKYLSKIKEIIYSKEALTDIFKDIKQKLMSPNLKKLNLILDAEDIEKLKLFIESGQEKIKASRKRGAKEIDKLENVNTIDSELKEIEDIYISLRDINILVNELTNLQDLILLGAGNYLQASSSSKSHSLLTHESSGVITEPKIRIEKGSHVQGGIISHSEKALKSSSEKTSGLPVETEREEKLIKHPSSIVKQKEEHKTKEKERSHKDKVSTLQSKEKSKSLSKKEASSTSEKTLSKPKEKEEHPAYSESGVMKKVEERESKLTMLSQETAKYKFSDLKDFLKFLKNNDELPSDISGKINSHLTAQFIGKIQSGNIKSTSKDIKEIMGILEKAYPKEFKEWQEQQSNLF